MVAERCESADAGALVLIAWATALDRVFVRIAHRFKRAEVRARVRRYLAGLLGRVERKNGWQVAEAIGEEGPQGVQRLLNAAVWDAEAVREDLRAYVIEYLGDPGGVLIVDESGFPKKGFDSCGVASQYCGTLGRIAPCQVGVFLGYASARGMAFLDRALYLPRVWTADEARRAKAGVPAEVRFASKGELAKRMLVGAFAADVPAAWVVADSLYGRTHHFRRFLERQERAYVVGVLPGQVVAYDGRGQRAKAVAAALPPEAWVRQSAGTGSQGERVHDWACVQLGEPAPLGWARWLLVRQALEDPTERTYFRAFGPAATTRDELVRVAGLRWAIEEGLAQAKGEVGLDHYEVRTWPAWHRQMTLCLLAHAALVVTCALARRAEQTGAQKGGLRLVRR
jgi:SRSO17 transposase